MNIEKGDVRDIWTFGIGFAVFGHASPSLYKCSGALYHNYYSRYRTARDFLKIQKNTGDLICSKGKLIQYGQVSKCHGRPLHHMVHFEFEFTHQPVKA
jgi:hypothetical protein